MTTYKEKDLRELYRIDNKYWKTGDADLLSARIDAAEKVDARYWDCIASITSLATRKNLPVKKLMAALAELGFVAEEEKEES